MLPNLDNPRNEREKFAANVGNSFAKGGKDALEGAMFMVLCKLEATNDRAFWSKQANDAREMIEVYAEDNRPQADYMRRCSLMSLSLLLTDVQLKELSEMATACVEQLDADKVAAEGHDNT